MGDEVLSESRLVRVVPDSVKRVQEKLLSVSQGAPQQYGTQNGATDTVSDRPPGRHSRGVVDSAKDRSRQQVRNAIQDDQRTEPFHVQRQHPQRNAVHAIRIGRLADKKHQHWTMRHLAEPKPFMRYLHPGARHDDRYKSENLECARHKQQEFLYSWFIHGVVSHPVNDRRGYMSN